MGKAYSEAMIERFWALAFGTDEHANGLLGVIRASDDDDDSDGFQNISIVLVPRGNTTRRYCG